MFPLPAAASAAGEYKPTLEASATPTKTAIDRRIEDWIVLKSFSSKGENGTLVPFATGKFASKADKSTRKNESTPAIPAIHRSANSLVLSFIEKTVGNSAGGPS